MSESNALPRATRTILNLAIIWVHKVMTVVSFVIITPIITRNFGLEVLGIWVLITQITMYTQLLDAGVNTGLIRQLALQNREPDLSALKNTLSSTLAFLLTLATLLVFASPLITSAFLSHFTIRPDFATDAYWAFFVAFVITALSFPFRAGLGLLSSAHKLGAYFGIDLATIFLKIGLVVFLFDDGKRSLTFYSLVFFVPQLLASVVQFWLGLRTRPEAKIDLRATSIQTLIPLISIGLASLAMSAANMVLYQGPSIVVGKYIGTIDVVSIAYPTMIAVQLLSFAGAFGSLLTPVASAYSKPEDRTKLREIFAASGHYSLTLSLGGAGLLILFADPVFQIWLRSSNASLETISTISRNSGLLTLALAFGMPSQLGRNFLSACGKQWPAAYAELLACFIGLIVGSALAVPLGMGVAGMMIGICFGTALRAIVFLPWQLANLFEISWANLIINVFTKPIAIFFVALFLALSAQQLGGNLLVKSILSFCVFSGVWAYGSWALVIPDHRKNQVITKFSHFGESWRRYS